MGPLVAALVVASAVAASQPPTPSSAPTGTHDNEHSAAPNAASAPDTGRSPPALNNSVVQNATGNKGQGKEDHESSAEWWLVGLTAVLAAVTAWLVVETRRLADDTRRTSERQRAETSDALETANRSAEAAQSAVEESRKAADAAERMAVSVEDTARKQLRAYVWRHGEDHKLVWNKTAFSIGATLRNGGLTPARRVRCWAKLGVFDKVLPDAFVFTDGQPIAGEFVITPGSTHYMEAWALANEGDINDIRFGLKTLYVWGEVIYEDVFGITQKTRFRLYRHVFQRNEAEEEAWGYCKEGNEAT